MNKIVKGTSSGVWSEMVAGLELVARWSVFVRFFWLELVVSGGVCWLFAGERRGVWVCFWLGFWLPEKWGRVVVCELVSGVVSGEVLAGREEDWWLLV